MDEVNSFVRIKRNRVGFKVVVFYDYCYCGQFAAFFLCAALELLSEQPWDLGTNPQVVEKVLLRTMQLDSQGNRHVQMDMLASLTSSVCRSELFLMTTLSVGRRMEEMVCFSVWKVGGWGLCLLNESYPCVEKLL